MLLKLLKLSVLCAATAVAGLANAQSYPVKPVRLVVTSSPGAASDMLARIVAEQLGKALDGAFVVENRPGAGGNVAGEHVKNASADGYTLLLASVSSHAINPSLYSKMPYNSVKDFAPIIVLATNPNAVVVSSDGNVKSVDDLIKQARAKPGALTFSSGGNGTSQHLAGELFKSMTQTDILHIPYKGSPEAITSVMRGDATVMFPNIANALTLSESGKLKLLAVTTKNRLNWLPEVPTLAESGLPGFEAVAWFGLVAPAGTPADVVQTLNREANKVLQLPEVKEKLVALGFDPMGGSPADFTAFLNDEIAKWAKVIADARINKIN